MRKIFALIGSPVSHSLSAAYFNDYFHRYRIDAEYLLQELHSVEEIRPWLEMYPLVVGLNITSPYKQKVLSILDDVDSEALLVGAVNTIVVRRSEDRIHLSGYNTDVYGVEANLSELKIPTQARALIFGTGGGAQAARRALLRLGCEVYFVSRTPRTPDTRSYEELTPEMIQEMDILLNATPLGMADRIGEAPSLPYEALSSHHLCMDMIYNPRETLFLRRAREQGANTINGLKMLYAQAQRAWTIWWKEPWLG